MLYIYTKKNFVLIRVKVLKLIERSSTSIITIRTLDFAVFFFLFLVVYRGCFIIIYCYDREENFVLIYPI